MRLPLAGSWPTGHAERTHGRGAQAAIRLISERKGLFPNGIYLASPPCAWQRRPRCDLGFVTSGMSRFAFGFVTNPRVTFRISFCLAPCRYPSLASLPIDLGILGSFPRRHLLLVAQGKLALLDQPEGLVTLFVGDVVPGVGMQAPDQVGPCRTRHDAFAAFDDPPRFTIVCFVTVSRSRYRPPASSKSFG